MEKGRKREGKKREKKGGEKERALEDDGMTNRRSAECKMSQHTSSVTLNQATCRVIHLLFLHGIAGFCHCAVSMPSTSSTHDLKMLRNASLQHSTLQHIPDLQTMRRAGLSDTTPELCSVRILPVITAVPPYDPHYDSPMPLRVQQGVSGLSARALFLLKSQKTKMFKLLIT